MMSNQDPEISPTPPELLPTVPVFEYGFPIIPEPDPRDMDSYVQDSDLANSLPIAGTQLSRNDFLRTFSVEHRCGIYQMLTEIAETLGIPTEEILLAGFYGDYTGEELDARKLESPAVGEGLNSSNLLQQNIRTTDEINGVIKDIAQHMLQLDQKDQLDDVTRAKLLAEIESLKRERQNPTPAQAPVMEAG